MAVINNPDLRAIAMRIVSTPGFGSDQQAMRRALRQWYESVTDRQREAAEQALIIRWLEDVHAEHMREQDRARPEIASPETGALAKVIAGHLANEQVPATAPPDTPLPVSELRFRSESPDWASPPPQLPPPVPPVVTEPAVPPRTAPVMPRQDVPRSGPVTVTNAADRPLVQQPSRKVASYRQMFPELAFPVATERGAKPLAEFTTRNIDFRIATLGVQQQEWQTANAGDESRIEERDRLNAKDRVRVAERARNMRDARDEQDRLARARREMDERGCEVIGELPVETLAACGFKRSAAA